MRAGTPSLSRGGSHVDDDLTIGIGIGDPPDMYRSQIVGFSIQDPSKVEVVSP